MRQRTAAILAFLAATGAGTVLAEDIIFTIDPNLSVFNVAATDDTYGAFQAQTPGSLSAPLSGHFLVSFDPLSGTPSTLQFIGGHGFYEVGSPHVASPGIGTVGPPAAANIGAVTAGGEVSFAFRDIVWDYDSPAISGSGGVFPANQVSFTVASGSSDAVWAGVGSDSDNYVGASDELTGGSWTLSESSPGSGQWTLSSSDVFYTYTYSSFTSGTITDSGVIVSTAQFSSANIDPVDPGDTQTEALGGASTVGGVSAEFSEPVGGGTFTVQQVPDATSLSQAALAAAEANPIFALSTEALSVSPQIWNVDFSGDLGGASVELVFHYDQSLLPVGLDELTLGIWHFDSILDDWEFGGTVDPVADTITYTTDNFSPFMLGVVPEPSAFVLSAVALVGLVAFGRLRRRR